MHEDTKIVRGLDEERFHKTDAQTNKSINAHRLPIYQTSTFIFDSLEEAYGAFTGEEHHHIYTRVSNPNALYLGKKVALLEGAEAGVAFNSGMAAIATTLLTLLKPGDRMVSSKPVYGGTGELFAYLQEHLGIRVDVLGPEEFYDALKAGGYRVAYVETPGNPTLTVYDIELVSNLAHENGAVVVVDNTFATPFHQKPIRWGADIVLHSTTKYLNGHGDTIGGVVVGSEEFVGELLHTTKMFGTLMQPFNAWLTARGIRTLAVRMRKHSENAMRVARFLESRPEVVEVYYPGLESFPYHHIAKKQMEKGYSGMVSFVLDGTRENLKRFITSLRIFHFAVSLGDTDSLATSPALTTHALSPTTDFPANLVRLSVGLEDAEDLIADLESALKRAFSTSGVAGR
ncbi:MAG: aminotransferase class I/II-fold pyridoxal phosphate-dependent enzyme [Thermotogae bacterium]|nr:aminotransferase class I/II-fold pyridoxal phosphate-dependent enzyme [Thermotogota bacterium]